jgi:hypothetical protein
MGVMIVLHFAKVSTPYPRVVISSLAKQLKKHLFWHSYTSFSVWPRDHYMSLQSFTMGRMPLLAKVVCGTIAMLRFPGVVHSTTAPLALCEHGRVIMPISHSSEQGLLPTASLISKQVVPYRICGGTCCDLCILERESILEQNSQGSFALLSHRLLLKVLDVEFLKIPKVIGA